MAQNFLPTQFLKTLIASIRPVAGNLLLGQPAVNLEDSDPGLYFRTSNDNLVKVGPTTVGTEAPNAISRGGDGTNSPGEAWLDTGNSDGAVLKVFDGTNFVPCFPVPYARVIASETPPTVTDHLEFTLWWRSTTGHLYILSGSGSDGQWVQITN